MKRLPLLLLLSITFFGCQKDKKENLKEIKPDTAAPSDVTNLKLTTEENSITLTWSDPSDQDLKLIEIDFEDTIANVARNVESITFNDLLVGKKYIFHVFTIDSSNNKSYGIQISGQIDYRESFIGNYYGQEIWYNYPPYPSVDTTNKNYLVSKSISDSCIIITHNIEENRSDSCFIDASGNAILLGSEAFHWSNYSVKILSDSLIYYKDMATSGGMSLSFKGKKE